MTRWPHAVRPLVLLSLLAAATSVRAERDPSEVPPTDPSYRVGTLDNGMRYFIRANPKPENRVELRLAVDVGSVQETEAERGIAHFAEHMSFNGTAHFPPGEIVSYLESIGARFAADTNASTSHDETVYRLQVPTDKPGALDKGLAILADWAGQATFAPAEVEKERGVVADELRGRKGAAKRIKDKQDQVLFKGSRYAERSPIGLESVIMGASPELMRAFYQRWYRPEIMAVVAVGTIDVDATERKVRELFGVLPKSPSPLVVPEHPVPAHEQTLYSVDADKEFTASVAQLVYKHPARPEAKVGDIRRGMVEGLAGSLLSRRLAERAEEKNPPFIWAGGGVGRALRTLEVFNLGATAKDGHVPRALAALVDEIERARRFGFLPAELERAKASWMTSAENVYAERDQQRSATRAAQAVSAFLNELPLTSDEYDFELTKELVPGITLDEVNDAFRRLTDTSTRVVLVRTPAGEGVVPSEEEVRRAVEPEVAREVAAYTEDLEGKSLMEGRPEPGRIVSRHAVPEVGVEELQLGNGLRLVVKTTDFKNDEIRLQGFARGGAASVPLPRLEAAIRVDALAAESGLGDLTAAQLRKLLEGKAAAAAPGVSLFTRSFSGWSTPKDFETMLQLVHLAFTRPAFRPDALRRLVDSEVEALRNQLNSPQGVYGIAVTDVAYDGNPIFRTPTVADIEALRLDEMERIYRYFFDDASEWTFFLVGNVDLGKHGPLIEAYLGSLPTAKDWKRRDEGEAPWAGLDIHFPAGRSTRMVGKGVEDQARTILMFDTPYALDVEEGFRLGAVADLLDIRLRELLREQRGKTYGVGAGVSNLAPYPHYGRFQVTFGCSPDARGGLVADTFTELRRLKTELPSEAEVNKVRLMRTNALDEGLRENGFWMSRLWTAYLLRRDPRTILEERARIERLDAKALRDTARRWIDFDRSAEVYLVPESWGPAKWLATEATGL
jgi:zinc protease